MGQVILSMKVHQQRLLKIYWKFSGKKRKFVLATELGEFFRSFLIFGEFQFDFSPALILCILLQPQENSAVQIPSENYSFLRFAATATARKVSVFTYLNDRHKVGPVHKLTRLQKPPSPRPTWTTIWSPSAKS